MNDELPRRVITDIEVGNYIVCPEAWRLKYVALQHYQKGDAADESKEIRDEWIRSQELSAELRAYTKIAFILLAILVAFVFTWDQWREHAEDPEHRIARILRSATEAIPFEAAGSLITLGVLIFIWDLFERRRKTIARTSGVSTDSSVLALRGSEELPAGQYHSEKLGLSSKPDALLNEHGITVPVLRKPMTSKIRDRHVIQLLAHCRLIEESEGTRPPYGVLLLGKQVRRVQIKYTEEKERWLISVLEEMRSVLAGVPAHPAPTVKKCKHCDVRSACDYSAYKPSTSAN